MTALYHHHQWTHWLFPLIAAPAAFETTSAFAPYAQDSVHHLRRLNSHPALGLFHTLPPLYATAHGILNRTRTAYFTVTGQITEDDLTLDTVPAPAPYDDTHTVTRLSFWIEARPDPASRREWRSVLQSLQALVGLVGQPVDTSDLFITSAGTVRIRVQGAYWRQSQFVRAPSLYVLSHRSFSTILPADCLSAAGYRWGPHPLDEPRHGPCI